MTYSIGDQFPQFLVKACVSIQAGKEFSTISNSDFKGQWNVLFFYPLDFTFVCPTELVAFNKGVPAFKERNASVYGASADSHFSHLAWRQATPPLKDLQYPLLSDYKKELCEALGILHPTDKVPLRATYIIDPDGIIRWLSINDLKVGRSVKEVLRTLDALQTDELCPCDWEQGLETIRL